MHSALTLHNLSVCINGKQRELSVPHQAGRPAGVHQYRQQAFKNISENIFENRLEISAHVNYQHDKIMVIRWEARSGQRAMCYHWRWHRGAGGWEG